MPVIARHERCIIKIYPRSECFEQVPGDARYVTVWVHGLRLIGLNTRNLGLWPARKSARGTIPARVERSLTAMYHDTFSAEHVFMFKWSAGFSLEEREKAACQLYQALKQVCAEYNVGKNNIKLRLIGFSEGGNVVLSLPKFKDGQPFSVDELVLIGTPVQDVTACNVTDPMFKRVFNLYSSLDAIQIIQPQAKYSVPPTSRLSTRRFKDSPNLVQAKVRLNGHGMGHFGLEGPDFVSSLDCILRSLNQVLDCRKQLQDAQPIKYVVSVHTNRDPSSCPKK